MGRGVALTKEEQSAILALGRAGKSFGYIAKDVGRSKTGVQRQNGRGSYMVWATFSSVGKTELSLYR